MKNRILLIALTILTSGGLLVPGILRGQDPGGYPGQPQPQPQPQPQYPTQPQAPSQPSAVGRLSVVHGEVSTMHGDNGQWVAGTVNTPVVPGDKVATADRARAEIQLDDFNVMRLDQRSEAQVSDLQQTKIQIQLASGLADYSALNGTQADVEIDTPNMGVHPLAPGVYHVLVNSATDTQLIVRQGEAEVLTNQGSTKVEAGQIIQIRGSDNPEYKIDPAPGVDDFDKWCMDRDHHIQGSEARERTGPEYTGSSDMDGYGQWNEVPDYGWCWTPEVDAGWVPYSAGYWGWEPYWGWTWISAEPWGWAPYHYGRWFMWGGRWRWWPAVGFYGPHPIWAPAYVSFFGFGGAGFGVGFGFGFGSIGWLALGPRDIFHPWWGPGRAFGAVGFGHLGAGWVRPGGQPFGSNLERAMTDARMRNAITHVSAQDFAAGRMSHLGPVSEGMLRNASMVRGGLGVTPTRAAMGTRVGNMSSYRLAPSNQHIFSSRSSSFNSGSAGRFGGNAAGSGTRSNGAFANRAAGTGWQGRTGSSAGAGVQHSWDRYASPSPYGGGRQGYQSGSRGWSGAAPRSGSSYYGGGSRPAMQLNRPIMRERAPSGGYYGGARGGYSSSSGGSRGGYSAPRTNGGGGSGGHHSGGGEASHSGGGGGGSHGGGGGHSGGGGRH